MSRKLGQRTCLGLYHGGKTKGYISDAPQAYIRHREIIRIAPEYERQRRLTGKVGTFGLIPTSLCPNPKRIMRRRKRTRKEYSEDGPWR